MTLVATSARRRTQWVMRGQLLDEQIQLPPGAAKISLERNGKLLATARTDDQGEFQLRWQATGEGAQGLRLHVEALGYGESFRAVRVGNQPQAHRIGSLSTLFEVRGR